MTIAWTDERVETLKKMWLDGQSASQIASELGGVTRNAVIGKVHRLGLARGAKSTSSAPVRPRKPAATHGVSTSSQRHYSAPAAPRTIARGNTALATAVARLPSAEVAVDLRPVEEVVIPMSARVTIMELRENTCRWPLGDPTSSEFRFCGNATGGAGCGPYCAYHSSIAYQPSHDRRREKRND